MKLCDECGIRKARGMYAKDGKTKQYCMHCITKLYPDLAKTMQQYSDKMNQQYQYTEEECEEIIDILPLVPKSKRYPVMNIIYCKTCNFYPITNLPSIMAIPSCYRCKQELQIIPAHMKAIRYNSYMTSEVAN